MSTYLIANRDSEQLETIVFSAEGGDAVAVFTDPANAQNYIDDAGWGENFTVASLQPIELMEWLLNCYRNGVRLMATDPERRRQESGQRLNVLDIEGQLEHAGRHINLIANPDF